MASPDTPEIPYKREKEAIMKRLIAVVLLISLICGLFSGCDFWMDGYYVSVEPHTEQNYYAEKEVVEITSNSQLLQALVELVEKGVENGIISVSSFNQTTAYVQMDSAIRNVMNNHPVGVYAVGDITYEIGNADGLAAIAVNIAYRRDYSQVLRIKKAETVGEAEDYIYAALMDIEPSVAIRLTDDITLDCEQIVRTYAAANPDIVIEVPQVTMRSYPENAKDRIVEVVFAYRTSRESLSQMQEQVATVFTSAQLYVQSETQMREKYIQLYNFLMERFDYTIANSITPAYSLLLDGIGDGAAFATVYAAMCRKAGMECHVITGYREGEPWMWNMIYYMGGYYHLDLLVCSQSGGFAVNRQSEITEYEWDQSAYPGR